MRLHNLVDFLTWIKRMRDTSTRGAMLQYICFQNAVKYQKQKLSLESFCTIILASASQLRFTNIYLSRKWQDLQSRYIFYFFYKHFF